MESEQYIAINSGHDDYIIIARVRALNEAKEVFEQLWKEHMED